MTSINLRHCAHTNHVYYSHAAYRELYPWHTCWPLQELHRLVIILQLCVIITELDLWWWSSSPISSTSPSLMRMSWNQTMKMGSLFSWYKQMYPNLKPRSNIGTYKLTVGYFTDVSYCRYQSSFLGCCLVGHRTLFGGCADSADRSVMAGSVQTAAEAFRSAFRGNTQSSSISCSCIRTTHKNDKPYLWCLIHDVSIGFCYSSLPLFERVCRHLHAWAEF